MLDEISTLATECLGLFQLSLQKSPESPRSDANDLDLKNLKKLADEHTRFSQWVVAASALEKGPESLEYRLKDASHIRLRIINLIQRVEQLLRDLLNIMQGDSTPWDQLSSEEDSSCDEISRESPGSELAQTVLHISRSVEDLLDLKIAIRDPAPHDMMIRDQFSWPLSFELEDNTPYLQDEYPTIDRDLARRLNAAVSARRRYFKYRQAIDSDETIVGKLSIQDEVAVSASEPHKTSDKLVGGAQAADTDFDTSDTTTAAGEIKLPPLPKPARSGNAFTCPYCRIMMRISSVTEWREHLFNDIRPYICLEKNCDTMDRQYVKRQQWMNHVLQHHWKVYRCPSECGCDFPTFRTCYEHFYNRHREQESPSEINALVRLCSSNLEFKSGVPCPLCEKPLNSVSQYQAHVGRHQEKVALLSLSAPGINNPRAVTNPIATSLPGSSEIDSDVTIKSQVDKTPTRRGYFPKGPDTPKGSHKPKPNMWRCYYCFFDNVFVNGEVCISCQRPFHPCSHTYYVPVRKERP